MKLGVGITTANSSQMVTVPPVPALNLPAFDDLNFYGNPSAFELIEVEDGYQLNNLGNNNTYLAAGWWAEPVDAATSWRVDMKVKVGTPALGTILVGIKIFRAALPDRMLAFELNNYFNGDLRCYANIWNSYTAQVWQVSSINIVNDAPPDNIWILRLERNTTLLNFSVSHNNGQTFTAAGTANWSETEGLYAYQGFGFGVRGNTTATLMELTRGPI